MLDIFKTIWENENSVNAEQGFQNGVLYEPANNPMFLQSGAEKVIKGQNNTYIVLGRDRPGGLDSGYGSKGHEKAGAIDIVVGRLSSVDATTLNGYVDPSFGADGARIYLSQKTDVDTNFGIAEGRTGSSIALSAVALKADDIRVIARNSLKLVTNTDAFLSTGDRAVLSSGVQLINNADDSELQPIPKGDNLVKAINELLEQVLALNGIVDQFMKAQKIMNDELTNHTHYSPFYGLISSPSPEALPAGITTSLKMLAKVEQQLSFHVVNLMSYRTKYLFASSTDTYINSSYHYLN
jgi:hypothetical protein